MRFPRIMLNCLQVFENFVQMITFATVGVLNSGEDSLTVQCDELKKTQFRSSSSMHAHAR